LPEVGLSVARMANGLEMKVIATDPYASPEIAESNNVTLMSSLLEVLTNCDFLTIHTPLIASTRGMISKTELESMKKGSRILNVARGGMIDEAALLEALESGQIAGAGIDVFTTEPPTPDGTAAKLLMHPRVVATPHLGASTVEAQENVALDVCDQVLEILRGGLPRAAVNAPIILPEEYRKLQPFVKLVEQMGRLYTQHFKNPYQTFDLIYEGEICNITNTKPLYASLVRGLTKEISSATGINIVNANIVARERGIIINEQYSRESGAQTYSSLVTLRARPTRLPSQDRDASTKAAVLTAATAATVPSDQHVISGYCSDTRIFISRLGRFATNFIPQGTLLICHNYDSPGKIGVVGSVLGKAGVNIRFMTVAPLTPDTEGYVKNEALMILGLDGEVGGDQLKQLGAGDGFLSAALVKL
jgi:D-3-phosphoglycerate dehydrogenase / 2-oxoglutarate reductase